jgi:hypothetical protein
LVWLAVSAGYFGANAMKHFVAFCLKRKFPESDTDINISMILFVILEPFNIGWTIYGCTFMYNEEAMRC